MIIIVEYLKWHFVDMPKEILGGLRNILWFGLNYFSLPLLLRTYFWPWRRLQWKTAQGFNLGAFFEVLLSNLISRIIGASIRTGVLAAGIVVQVLLIVVSVGVFIGWFLLPFLATVSLYYGFSILF